MLNFDAKTPNVVSIFAPRLKLVLSSWRLVESRHQVPLSGSVLSYKSHSTIRWRWVFADTCRHRVVPHVCRRRAVDPLICSTQKENLGDRSRDLAGQRCFAKSRDQKRRTELKHTPDSLV